MRVHTIASEVSKAPQSRGSKKGYMRALQKLTMRPIQVAVQPRWRCGEIGGSNPEKFCTDTTYESVECDQFGA